MISVGDFVNNLSCLMTLLVLVLKCRYHATLKDETNKMIRSDNLLFTMTVLKKKLPTISSVTLSICVKQSSMDNMTVCRQLQ